MKVDNHSVVYFINEEYGVVIRANGANKEVAMWDGHVWTYGELANEYGFSRPRAVQICQTTEKHLKAHYAP